MEIYMAFSLNDLDVYKRQALCTCMDDAAVEAKLAEIPKVDYDRIGERMYAELVYVNCGEGADAAKYTALVEKAAGLGRTLVLDCKDCLLYTSL